MMNKRKIGLIIGSLILILTAARFAWIELQATPDHPQAVKGVLDLRGWNFAKGKPVTLDGEWEFYPGKLLVEDGEAAQTQQVDAGKSYIQVPESWNSSLDSRTSMGFGSYRLRVLINPADEQAFSIRAMKITASSETFVDGRLTGSSGHPAPDGESYKPSLKLYTSSFTTDRDEIEIVIQAANFSNPTEGGIVQSVNFGSSDAVKDFTDFSVGMQELLCAILLIHAVYACILFFIGARQHLLILFALINISTILLTVLADDRMLLEWSTLSYAWYVKLVYLSLLGIEFFLLRFCQALVPAHSSPRIVRWYSLICIVSALFVLFMPAADTLKFSIINSLVGLFGPAMMFLFFLRAALKGEEDSIFLLVGTTAIATNVIWSMIKTANWLEMYFYPIDLITAFLAFAAFWFKRYFRTAEQTGKLARKLQLADKEKDEFLANTSHELRNPLHGILNIAQTVLDNSKDTIDDNGRRNLELIVTVGRRMTFMLGDLLDLSRLRENGITLHTSPLSVPAIASGVLDMLRFMTEGKPIRLINQIPGSFPLVNADENRLIQILFNLLHNAVKYTNAGSVAIRGDIDSGMARIIIEDTGIGMDEETMQRIFQPYEQGNSGMTAIGGGIGLGLSISKQMVELHGGTLQARSVLGRGSVFTFTLPLAGSLERYGGGKDEPGEAREIAPNQAQTRMPSAAATAASSIAAAAGLASVPATDNGWTDLPPKGERPQILAVDDDPLNLNILVGLLSSDRYEVITASNGHEAMSLLDTRAWDLVISDVMMPQMSGYELSRTIRERFSVSELPILLLTARSRSEDIQTGFMSGANDYLTKPVDAAELRARVRALTELRASVRERLRMEAAWLQAQIQPHFLFNTLNSVAALSEFDVARMRNLLEAFGNYLRTSFDFANTEKLVPLKHELDLVRSYLFIEKERFKDRLNIVWESDPGIYLRIPPLSIQPLVENAVRHGICKRARGGTIRIRIDDRSEYVEITIADDGVGMSEDTVRDLLIGRPERTRGIGLLNTERRLKQLYGRGLEIRSQPDQGTSVSFRVQR